jgi:hypothetical protein
MIGKFVALGEHMDRGAMLMWIGVGVGTGRGVGCLSPQETEASILDGRNMA